MSMLLWNLCKASLSTGSHGVASLGVQHIAGSSLLHATLVGVGTGWGETGVWPYEAVTRYVSWCGNPYTMIFRLFQCRGPKHFPEEAEICVRWSFFFFSLVTFLGSLIDYYPLGLTNRGLKTTAVNTHTNQAMALTLFVGCRSLHICFVSLDCKLFRAGTAIFCV